MNVDDAERRVGIAPMHDPTVFDARREMRDLNPDGARFGVSGGASLPPHASATYYEQPLLKKPHWEWEVITYLFLGGIMGGSGILTALADEAGEDAELARNARYVAFVLASTCPIVLVKHLGRPERFLHMLRIVKFKSVMSMGVWGLIAFSLPASAGAVAQAARDGLLPKPLDRLRFVGPRAITNPLSAIFGAFIGGYTGVLLSATAIPIWAIGKRHIPAFSASSGIAGACALNAALLVLEGDANPVTLRRLERLELVASLTEAALLLDFRRHAGALGDPMFRGKRGRKLAIATLLSGIAVPAVLNVLPFHGRLKTLVASGLTLVGGYILRDTLIEAGKNSADDPRAASRQPE
ncbi:MAG: polysulfide reductase NrfD [Vulcanimicrobiaceae bacterium]